MQRPSDYDELLKQQEEQMVRLVTQSFYSELIKSGIKHGGIVAASTHLLDYVVNGSTLEESAGTFYNQLFRLDDIEDFWQSRQELRIRDVSIVPLAKEHITLIHTWLLSPEIRPELITPLPENRQELGQYLMDSPTRRYFGILYGQHELTGIIGAENIDTAARKVEMKKFVGRRTLRGKGIGKHATLLFLYYVYNILQFNKVYIHSINTNIRNLNLNTRFGFELEGISKEDIIVNEEYKDVVKMGLVRRRFDQIFGADLPTTH